MGFLALRQLFSRKRQTLFVILGVMLGTAAYVAFSGMMLGFQSYLIERLIDNNGHVHISARQKEIGPRSLDEAFFGTDLLVKWWKAPSGRRDYARIEHPAGWFDWLDHDARVVGYSQQIIVQALAQRGTISTAVRVTGIDPARHEQVTRVDQFVSGGRKLDEIGRSGNRIIVGKGLLTKLGAAIGENIQLSAGNAKPQSFRVVNTIEMGMPQIDDVLIYGSLADVQKLNGTPSQLTDIIVRLTDVGLAAPMASGLSALASDKVQSWEQENEGILSVFSFQTMVRNFMSLSIILVAGFGIYNILNMIVAQKRKEIGILRSMGYRGAEISHLFLYQGLFFGLVGGLLGISAGFGLCHLLEHFHIGIPGTTSYRPISVTYDWRIYLKAFSLALSSAILAGFIPSRAAGRFNPIEIIRSEGG